MKRVLFLLFVLWASLFSTSMSAQDSYLVVNTSVLRYNPDGATQTFEITSNVDWTISVEGGDEWIEVTPLSGNGNKEISVSATTNTNTDPRETTISISGNGLSLTVKIYQAGTGYLTTNKTRLLFNPDEGTQTFDITSNVDWTISVEGGDGWLTVSPMSGFGNQKITVKVEESNGYSFSPHEATIIISSGKLTQTIKVYQSSSPYLAVSTNDIRFGFDDSTQKFTISSNVDWDISIEGGTDWLTVTPLSGRGEQEVTVAATANTNPNPREASITISGGGMTQTVNVTQYGNGYLTVNTAELKYNPTAYEQTFSVSSNVSWNITMEGGNGWLTVMPISKSVSYNDVTEVTVKVTDNTGNSSPRTATLTISGGGMTQTVNVTQYGNGYLTASTTELRFNITAYEQKVSISSNVSWTITMEGGDGWLTVTPTSKTVSGNDATEVTVRTEDNTSAPRTATLTISGGGLTQKVQVLQYGTLIPPQLPSDLKFHSNGGIQKFNIACNVNWHITMEGGYEWLTVTPTSKTVSGNDVTEVTVKAEENIGISREATIIITSGGITQSMKVYQEGNGYLTANTTELKFDPDASEQKFIVSSNVNWNITMEGGHGWLMVTPISKSLSGNDVTEVTVEVTDNTGSISPRSATITISGNGLSQIIKVYQSGIGYINVNANQINLAANQTLSFNIMSNIDWSITIEDGAGWLGVNPMNGYGDQEISLERINQQYMGPGYATLIIYGYGITQTIHVTLWGLDAIDNTLRDEGKKSLKTIYDLSGRRTTCSTNDLGKLRQGVYIINGKKYLIK